MDIYFVLWVIMQYYFIYFICSNCSRYCFWWLGARSIGSCAPLTYTLSVGLYSGCLFLEHLLSGTKKCSRLILYIFCSSPRISHFFKMYWFFWLEKSVINQDLGVLGVLIAIGVSLLLGLLSWLSKEIYFVYINPFYPYIYKSFICHICIYINLNMSLLLFFF